ncbi:MAG: tripartite tricarboxylate transporter substrate binding protein [Pseudomonadota bacterium]
MHTHSTSAPYSAAGRRSMLGRLMAFSLSGLLAVAAAQVAAQAPTAVYPTRPIRVISPYPAGLSPDLAMRVLAEKLSRRLGQQVFIDARPGGNGFIAVNSFKQAQADGHTLLLVSNAHLTMNPYLFKKLPYDTEKDFEAISTIYRAPFFIATSAAGPHQDIGQLVGKARGAPGRVTYSIPYVGSPPHFGGAVLAHLSDTKMMAIPYKDGAQLGISASTGEVDFTVLSMGSLNPLVKAGKLKVVAVAAPARSVVAPNVPTVEEAGGPKGVTVESWVGLVGLRGTPPEVVKKLNEEITRALAEQDLVSHYASDGVAATAMTPAAMTQMIRADLKTNATLLPQLGMQAE